MFYPMRCMPIYKEKIWGGRKLEELLHKDLPEGQRIGESWELCVHTEGKSIIINGQFAGRNLGEIIEEHPRGMLGSRCLSHKGVFPLLVKFIDAQEQLSIQVHPDDAYANTHENSLGKTEMWYILFARPGAKVIQGLKKATDSKMFEEALEDGSIEKLLEEKEVKAGDILYIPAGTVHGIGAGVVLAEIQQNSDITYRVYDWERPGLDGKPRVLHIQKALDVINFSREGRIFFEENVRTMPGWKAKIYDFCPYFTVEAIEIEGQYNHSLEGESFEVIICVEGDLHICYDVEEIELLRKGDTVFLPASLGDYTMKGKGKILKTYV